MKLWQRISLISISVAFLMMGTAVGVIVGIQAGARRRADEEYAASAIEMLCSNCVSAAEAQGGAYRDMTLRSVVQFYFSQFASVMRDGNTWYSLAADGKYLFNRCLYDPAGLLKGEDIPDSQEGEALLFRTFSKEKVPLLICAQAFTISGQEFQVYICRDVSNTEGQIKGYWAIGFGVLSLSCGASAVLTALLLRASLKPVAELTQRADLISKGSYRLRTNAASRDEIGQLSAAFDRMAESIEERIASLDRELERRQFLIGALSHEIKTPMTAVVGYGETLLRMPLDREQQAACAEKIVEAGKRTASLSQKMMELIGLTEQGNIEKREIPIYRLAERLRDIYPERVRFIVEAGCIYGDEALLCSLVGNLVQNALRASPEKGEVVVAFTEEGDFSVITVTDQGDGIPPEHIPLLTEPFYRVDKARSRQEGGAGLGLAICREIAVRHGGTLTIASDLGKGTTVRASAAKHTT